MTVVMLESGGLLVHSPVAPSRALCHELDNLGTVRHVVAPNLYHHIYVGDFLDSYPTAKLHGPAALAAKRRDLTFHSWLGDQSDPEWSAQLDQQCFAGSAIEETVFYHRSSRTLICSDLVDNFAPTEHWATWLYLQARGGPGGPGVSWFKRRAVRDRAAARASIDQMLAWEPERIVLAHGDIIEAGGCAVLSRAYAWL